MHWMVRWPGQFPVYAVGANGARFRDVDGLEYVDFCLGDTGAMAGHSPEPTVRAIAEQATRGITLMLPSEDALVVSRELARRFGLPRWQFALTATDANRFAIRLARHVTERPKLLVFNWCYHGTVDETFASLDDAGRVVERDANIGPPVPLAETTRVVEWNDAEALERELAHGDVACVLAEPALTNIGIVPPEPGFHELLRESTRRHGTLLIIDETHTLCAGPGGYTAAYGLEPDVLTVGKSIGGGIACAAYGFTDDVAARKGQYGLVDLWQPFLLVLVPVALVMKQPDLGTGVVTFAIAMTMIVFAKVRWQSLTALFAGGIASSVFAWQRLLKPYQKSRIVTFLDPQAYAKGAGYHAIQSVIAVGSGQWSGKGWSEGTQNQLSFLPEQHTDFIFSVWAEEHGFLGGVLLVSLYGFLVLTALDVAANARDKFGSFLAIGIAALFFWHAFINIGMVTGMLPVVGVPLPLFSYGGSSVLADLLGVGILLNVSLRRFMF